MGKLRFSPIVRNLALAMIATVLLAACAPAAPSPTPAPAKPAAPAATTAPPAAAATAAPAKPAEPAAAPKPAAPAKLDTVTYGIGSLNALHWVVLAAERSKVFEQFGINLDVVLTQNVPAALQSLITGAIQITTTSPEGGFLAQDRTPTLAQIMGVVEANPYSVVGLAELSSAKDLKGKAVGASALKTGVDTVAARLILAENGLQDEKDYAIVPTGSVAERVAALNARSVQAIAHMEPFLSQLKEQGFKELARAADYPNVKGSVSVTVIANRKWYAENEDVAIRFVRGYQAATRWLYDPKNKDDAIKYLAERIKVEPKYVASAYRVFVEELKGYPVDARINRDILKQTIGNLNKLGVEVPKDVEQYLDDSLVEKALKSR